MVTHDDACQQMVTHVKFMENIEQMRGQQASICGGRQSGSPRSHCQNQQSHGGGENQQQNCHGGDDTRAQQSLQ